MNFKALFSPSSLRVPGRPVAVLAPAGALLSGCASVQQPHPDDPWEGFNRGVYAFNDTVDKAVLKPISKGYKAVTPELVDRGVTNFFGNIEDVTIALNNFLQLKIGDGLSDVMRVVVNSTFGMLGVLDVASEAGIEKHEEDFGQTLGYWGVDTGPYLVLPIFGPSNVRDGVGLVVDWNLDPIDSVDPDSDRWTLIALRAIDDRADLLSASKVLDQVAEDAYATLRDGYLQRRHFLVMDGEVSADTDGFSEDDLLFDDAPAPE